MKLVSIIAVNFNHSYVTEAMLHSVFNINSYPGIEVIIVDNGSDINPIPQWQDKYPGVTFIRSDSNLGFAGGNNLGIKHAKGDYLFLVNNDTELTENLVALLVNSMDSNEAIGIISPKIHYFDNPGMLQYAGYTSMNYYTGRNTCIGLHEQDNGQYDNLTGPTGYAHGAAMMVRRDALDKAGLMAENYFLYYEELDWCEKIKKAGYEVHVNMQALIYHKESVSVGKKTALKEYFMNRNRILFIRRNTSFATTIIFCSYFMTFVMPRNILQYIREKQDSFIPVFLRAVFWNVTNGINSSDLGYRIKR